MERKKNIWIIENIKPEWTTKAALGPKLLWARDESRMDGRLRDVREHEWIEKERKTKTKMAGYTQGVFERSHHQQHETIRQR